MLGTFSFFSKEADLRKKRKGLVREKTACAFFSASGHFFVYILVLLYNVLIYIHLHTSSDKTVARSSLGGAPALCSIQIISRLFVSGEFFKRKLLRWILNTAHNLYFSQERGFLFFCFPDIRSEPACFFSVECSPTRI